MRSLLTPLLVICLGLLGISSVSTAQTFSRLENYYRLGKFINIENGTVEATAIKPGWHSAQWNISLNSYEPDYYYIVNRWTNQYLNNETGELQVSQIGVGWHSAHWEFIQAPVLNTYYIRNRWTGEYLHTEDGNLELGSISLGWHSSYWYVR